MAVGDVYEVSFQGLCNEAPWAVVTHIKIKQDDGPASFPEQSILTLLENENNLIDQYKATISDQTVMNSIRIYRIHPSRGFPLSFPTGPHTGTTSNASLPANTGVRHRWYSTLNTKRGRGRKNWCGIEEIYHNNGQILNTLYDFHVLFANCFEFLYASGAPIFSFDFGVWSRASSPGTFRDLQQAVVLGTVTKQRNRTPM